MQETLFKHKRRIRVRVGWGGEERTPTLRRARYVGVPSSPQPTSYELVSQIGTSAHGTRRISTSSVGSMLVPVPLMSEQRQIASHLSAIDTKLAAEEKRRAALDNLFQSLLHNLMTGRVRVNHLFDELAGADPRVGPVGGTHGGVPLRGDDRGTGTR